MLDIKKGKISTMWVTSGVPVVHPNNWNTRSCKDTFVKADLQKLNLINTMDFFTVTLPYVFVLFFYVYSYIGI